MRVCFGIFCSVTAAFKSVGLVCALIFFLSSTFLAQDVQLLTEDFESGGTSMSLNNGGPGSNSGVNQWIVNNDYNGTPGYPNTTPQDVTGGGTIGFAPYSHYLHIYNSGSPVHNANYDPTSASDQFAYTQFGMCTYGLEDVHFSFFYLCEGSATAYGTVWYSADNGPWIQIGLPQYNSETSWQYQDITNAAFSNVGNLRFGFRFQNDAGAIPYTQSFSIDDINVVGSYSVTDPITINVISVSPNPVCEGGYVTIEYELSDTLCDGNYQIELSNSSGNFPTPFTTWVMPINYPQTTGTTSILLPAGASAAGCYTIRINRLSPPPAITGTASGCFEIMECPNVITTMQPVVTMDPFPVCVNSAIDIPFTSTGIFANNAYVCQLSEPDGTFSANPLIVGTSGDNTTYDPALGSLPGSVSGLIPATEPGCNYYVRIISTNPDAIGSPWGPFCIQECDINTNNMENLSFCVTDCSVEPGGQNELIDISINEFNTNATYLPGNVFTTQLLSSQNFGQIGSNGILGEVAATGDTQLNIHVPCLDSLGYYGLSTGMNYLRVIGTNSTDPLNELGTLIHLTIGAFSDVPQIISSYEYPSGAPRDTFCVGETAMLQFFPYDYFENSTYMWSCNGINNGAPFVSPSGANSNTLYVNLGGAGPLTFSIQKTNNGCDSPWTPDMQIVVLGDPVVNITGPASVCEGDTTLYQVPFLPNTYYSWSTSTTPNNIAYQDTSNNTMNIAFSQVGTYTLSLNVLNQCGSDDDTQTVNVVAGPTANAGPDEQICIGESVQIGTTTGVGYTYAWTDGTASLGTTNSINVSPAVTSPYYVTVTGNVGCQSRDTVNVEVLFPDPPAQYTDSICPGGYNQVRLNADVVGAYLWSNGDITNYTLATDTGQYSLAVQVAGEICPHLAEFHLSPLIPDPPVLLLDSVCPNGTASIQIMADSVGRYSWSTGSQTRIISVRDTGLYTVFIYMNEHPCPRTLQYTIIPDTCIIDTVAYVYEPLFYYVPNAFTPNSNDLNDYFVPVFSNPEIVRDYHLMIFNRWGAPVFDSNDPEKKWIGNDLGGTYFVPDGVYTWKLEFRNFYEVDLHGDVGTVTIFR